MSESRVLVVGPDEVSVSALLDHLAIAGGDTRRVVGEADALVDVALEDVDSVLVVGSDDRPAGLELLEAVRHRHRRVPVVFAPARSSDQLAGDAIDHDVAEYLPRDRFDDEEIATLTVEAVGKDPDEDRLVPSTLDDGGARKIAALHEFATKVEEYRTEEEVFRRAVRAAEDVLEFDICYFGVVVGDDIVPRAANARELIVDPTIMSVDEGVAGRTVRTGETQVVDDAAEDPDAEPVDSDFVSSLSIPVGDVGVFQAVSTEYADFDETDRELGELLVTHVRQAIDRVRYEEQLRTERNRFAALFENVPDPALRYELTDDEARILSVNAAFERVFGYDASVAVGSSLAELLVPEGEELSMETDAGGRRDTFVTEVERLTDAGLRSFLLCHAPIETGTGTASGYAIYTDISDLKRRERQLQRQNERLEEFARIVSHDLRNPLTLAKGHLQNVLGRTDDEDALAAIDALRDMETMIEDLLTLAREGQMVGDPEPVALGRAVDDAWRTTAVPEATIDIGSLPVIQADRDRLKQLLENLFRNAVEHGGDDPTITVGATGDGFFVADDGPGIPAEERDRVFDSGYTNAEDGTGFGLAIVTTIAEAHGWEVALDESESGGARFTFSNVEVVEEAVRVD